MPSSRMFKLCILMLACLILEASAAGNFYRDVKINFGGSRAKKDKSGQLLTLSLDKLSGSGFESVNEYLFGRFDMQIKLVSGNSAGIVTTFFLSSQGERHDEIDFEFLGNASGQPYTLHTNIYGEGKGNREQQFRLWLNPTAAFHTYSIVWNPQRIIFLVDGSPIRVFNNNEAAGIPFPKNQPMKVYCRLWNADDWATEGGRIKTDWKLAPFLASYRNFNADACVWSASAGSSCASNTPNSINTQAWKTQGLDAKERNRMRWVQPKFMIYDYCKDSKRFNGRFPAECRHSRFL